MSEDDKFQLLGELCNADTVQMAAGHAMARAKAELGEDWEDYFKMLALHPHLSQYMADGIVAVMTRGGPEKMREFWELYKVTKGATAQ